MTPNLLVIAILICDTYTYAIYDIDTSAYIQDIDYTKAEEVIETLGINPPTITITPEIECKA